MMQTLLDEWTALNPLVQAAILSVPAGIILSLVQRYWTACPWLPILGPDSTTQRKRLVAILLPLVGAVVYGSQTGNWQEALVAALGTLGASQTAKLWAPEDPAEAKPAPVDSPGPVPARIAPYTGAWWGILPPPDSRATGEYWLTTGVSSGD